MFSGEPNLDDMEHAWLTPMGLSLALHGEGLTEETVFRQLALANPRY
jgi:hypothetical protein